MAQDDDGLSAEATLTAQGRVSIPEAVRKAAGFEPGTKVYISVEADGVLRLQTRDQKRRRLREVISEQWQGDESAVDELVADRRAEAAREDGGA